MQDSFTAAPADNIWRDARRRFMANRMAVISLVFILCMIVAALIGPMLMANDYLQQNIRAMNRPPTSEYWFGTDNLGRDIFSRVVYGARTAFFVALVVTAIALTIGTALGLVAGYMGGKVDAVIMWITDMTMSLPNLLLVIVLSASLRPVATEWMDAMYQQTLNPFFRNTIYVDFLLVFGTMALVTWPNYCRIVRAQVLSVRSRVYVTAARSLGLPTWKILTRYVAANSVGPLIVAVSAGLGGAMVMESAFSFLGVGVRPPVPSWGNMISEGLANWRRFPHVLAAPAAVLATITVAFAFVGDGLNDAFNPRGKN